MPLARRQNFGALGFPRPAPSSPPLQHTPQPSSRCRSEATPTCLKGSGSLFALLLSADRLATHTHANHMPSCSTVGNPAARVGRFCAAARLNLPERQCSRQFLDTCTKMMSKGEVEDHANPEPRPSTGLERQKPPKLSLSATVRDLNQVIFERHGPCGSIERTKHVHRFENVETT